MLGFAPDKVKLLNQVHAWGCTEMCKVGSCRWDASLEAECPADKPCDNYEPCHVLTNNDRNSQAQCSVQKACKPHQNFDRMFVISDPFKIRAVTQPDEHIRCEAYQSCDILYHPQNYA